MRRFALFMVVSAACGLPTPEAPTSTSDVPLWPQNATIEPVVAYMPESDETSIESVARAITAKEPDPIVRLKALHDWVADRLRYDRVREAAPPHATQLARFWENDTRPQTPTAAFSMQSYGPYPPAADIVFHSRIGVCGDYASLLAELGKYAGIDIKYVTGYARSWGDDDEGYHAWNVAKVGDKHLMIDVTWDSQPYSTEYLFVPPDVFARSHFPDRVEDLHTTHEWTRVKFNAQPLTTPRFFGDQLDFASEVGNPMFAKDVASLTLRNPKGLALRAAVFPTRRTADWRYAMCTVKVGALTAVQCPLATLGDYQIAIEPEGDSFQAALALVHVING
jgi:transglutaminase/protease-like cytokinesis protein 3